MENGKCHFCDNDATTTRECDDGKTHPVCVGCANAWYDEYRYIPYVGPRGDAIELAQCDTVNEQIQSWSRAHGWHNCTNANEHERTCDVCGETGDTTCFTGSGICATENDDNIDAHLQRYITNRNTRTGQTWCVVERYATNGNGKRCAVDYEFAWYQRAIIANEHGERMRIWYHHSYWRIA